MNAPQDIRMSKAAFLRWVEGREGRYELIGGRVVMQDTGTWDHSDVVLAIFEVLRPRLAREHWRISTGQFSVEIGEDVRVADILVAPMELDRKSRLTDQGVLLGEVLSPSSERPDFGSKRELYQRLPSLEIYIVASQDEPRIWVWQRSRDAARAFPEKPTEIKDRAALIDLAHFGISFSLGELYQHVFPA